MIRITKPNVAPVLLDTEGTIKRQEHCDNYDNGVRDFRFEDRIYADATVKEQLITIQHGKCAFCESLVADDGHIEHFRPKSAVRPRRGTRLLKPGYYWLAYAWDNLLLCCAPCNQQYKGNLFPLVDEATRARCHNDDVDLEEPLLINPAQENPADHLAFDRFTVLARRGSAKGTATINMLQLNRRSLIGRRAQIYQAIQHILKHIRIMENLPGLTESEREEVIRDLQRELTKLTQPDAEFSAMAQACVS